MRQAWVFMKKNFTPLCLWVITQQQPPLLNEPELPVSFVLMLSGVSEAQKKCCSVIENALLRTQMPCALSPLPPWE